MGTGMDGITTCDSGTMRSDRLGRWGSREARWPGGGQSTKSVTCTEGAVLAASGTPTTPTFVT